MTRALSIALLVLLTAIFASEPSYALDEAIGRALFKRAWVPAPSSTTSNDGLGPLFNARSCAACHQGLDRARVEVDDGGVVRSDNLVMRFSDRAGEPDPIYGRQLQTSSVGAQPEGHISSHSDGYHPVNLAYGPLASSTRVGALQAPALRGLGQLDTIPDAEIAAWAENSAHRSDGVRGRVNWILDASGQRRVGRFGWKASQPSLQAQVETAFYLDMGLSTVSRPSASGDCTVLQQSCIIAPHGGNLDTPEMSREITHRITAYLASIQPTPAATTDKTALGIFETTGCATCHRSSLPGASGPVRAFTDLLLHDLGPRADSGATEAGVAGTEWRTAPLWGLSRIIENGAGLLHDGRAVTIDEAVEFHGGEATRAKVRFQSLPNTERERLIAFLKSL